MVLPAGFALPPLPYLVVLGVGLGLVGWGGVVTKPQVSAGTVIGFVPWMLVGASFHVVYQLELIAGVIRPFFGTPAAYLTTTIIAGGIWLLSTQSTTHEVTVRLLGGLGSVVFVGIVGWIVVNGGDAIRWPLIGLLASIVLASGTWGILRVINRQATVTSGWPGFFVVLGHGIDGVSTTIGIDILDLTERTPAADAILSLGQLLPTAEYIGVGWLFIVIKLVLASLIVLWFTDYIDEAPTKAYLLFTFLIAIGLGPGVHNLLLYLSL